MGKRILVVDNHPVILKFMDTLLTKEGHQVVTAEDGLSALDLLQTQTPDVMFIDLIMPNIDGKKLCQVIRRMPELGGVQLVILSGVAAEDAVDLADLGAQGCIAKGPFDQMARNVLNTLERLDRPRSEASAPCAEDVLGRETARPWVVTRELLSVKKHFEVILEAMAEGILEITADGRVIYANATAKRLTGRAEESLLGMSFTDLFEEPDRATISEVLKDLDAAFLKPSESSSVKLNGKLVLLDVLPIHDEGCKAILILNDINERRQMETLLQQSQKMEAVGVLAGGIAHDFNNILTAILGNVSLAKMYSEPGSKLYERLDQAETASMRAKESVQQLLAFARSGIPIKKRVTVAHLIADANHSIRGNTAFSCELSAPEDVWSVDVDPSQISQAIQNLILNAQEAMPSGGAIAFEVENIIVDAARELPLNQGRYVKIAISDQGMGILNENLSRVFDPYFTTKHMGKGLGLALAYSIVRNHGGYVSLESRSGSGTTFYLYLPASVSP